MDWWALGKVGSVEKDEFNSNSGMWAFIKKHQGEKFTVTTKPLVSLAIRTLRSSPEAQSQHPGVKLPGRSVE